MPKKRQSTSAKKKTTTRTTKLVSGRNWRPLILIGLILAGVLIATALNTLRGPTGPSARGAADAFVGAMGSCDAKLVEKYAPLIALSEKKMAKFRENCKPGMITATFVNEKPIAGAGAILTYSVIDKSQPVYKKQTVLLTMIQDDDGKWEVGFVNGFLVP